jgi:hypothetical protein
MLVWNFNSLSAHASKEEKQLSSKELNENIEFRKKFGFDTDRDYVEKVMSTEIYKGTKEKYSVILTKYEADEMDKRVHLQKKETPKIKSYIKEHISSNERAGVYIDQINGGSLKIGFTKPLSEYQKHISNIKQMVTEPSRLKFFYAVYSEEELDRIHQKIMEDRESLKKEGIEIVGIATNVSENSVDVGVSILTNEIREHLKNKYGESIRVQEIAKVANESRSSYYFEMQGGLQLDISGGGYCSSAGTVKNSSGQYFTLTAAHCSNVGVSYYQGGSYLGVMSKTKYGSSADAGMISMAAARRGAYIYTFEPREYPIRFAQVVTADSEGDFVCKAGATTDYTCGVIKDKGVTAWFNGVMFSQMRTADYWSEPGDSGGSIDSGDNGLSGVHKGRYGSYAIYSHIHYVLQGLGVTLYTTN